MNGIEFVERYDVSGMVTDGPNSAKDGDWEHYAMTVRLSFRSPSGLREVEVPWKMGLGLDVGEFTGDGDQLPVRSVAQVIESLAFDFGAGRLSYPDFAEEYGAWDEAGYRSWQAAKDLYRELEGWCYSQAMADDLENVSEA